MTPNEELNRLVLRQPVVVKVIRPKGKEKKEDSFPAVVSEITGEGANRKVIADLDDKHQDFGSKVVLVADTLAWGEDCPIHCVNYTGYTREPGAVWYGLPAVIEVA